MLLIDRYILTRFFVNFAILLSILFVLAVSIDFILNLDEFVDRAQTQLGSDGGVLATVLRVVSLAVNFQGPRLFQFYAFLHGLVAVGAMAFSLAQMHAHKELVATMAAGVSLHRIAVPFIAAMMMLSLVQLLNQEIMLPRVAPLLLRSHGHIGKDTVSNFSVAFLRDGEGNLIHSPSFNPKTHVIEDLTIIERDEQGRTQRRISAKRGTWDAERGGWQLSEGRALSVQTVDAHGNPIAAPLEQLDFYHTDLSPQSLIVRRYRQFATMLSLRQINQMLDAADRQETKALQRHAYARFAAVLVNVLVMVITLPSFLLREPANLLTQSMRGALIAVPTVLFAMTLMNVDLPGISPAVGVFLPVVVLLPVAMARWTFVKT